jgi:hypothetical protein
MFSLSNDLGLSDILRGDCPLVDRRQRGDVGERHVLVSNNGANLGPFGMIDFPLDKASLFCSITPGGIPSPCSPQECNDILTNVVAGWALDVGARLDQGSVAYVELLLDGAIIAFTSSSNEIGKAPKG